MRSGWRTTGAGCEGSRYELLAKRCSARLSEVGSLSRIGQGAESQVVMQCLYTKA